jgi:hypothetical protein
MCTEAYAWGESGSNMCPENTTRIGSMEACQRSAGVIGKTWGGGVNAADWLSGCFWNKGFGSVFFNAHPVGSGDPDARPLCAVGAAPLAFARDVSCAIVQRTSRMHRHRREHTAATLRRAT